MSRTVRLSVIAIGVLVAACTNVLVPFPGVFLRPEVAPSTVNVGDTVILRGIMHNTTSEEVDVSRGCGPPVLFEFRQAGGISVRPFSGASTCELLDYHRLDPLETDTVLFRWKVDLPRGRWEARIGFRSRDDERLEQMSDAVELIVR